jgi:hypothetical protein
MLGGAGWLQRVDLVVLPGSGLGLHLEQGAFWLSAYLGSVPCAERLRMMQPQQLSWGTTATLKILRSGGWFSPKRLEAEMMHMNPMLTWYSMSSQINWAFSGIRVLTCKPAAVAALMTSGVQLGPQWAVHPL